MARRRKSVLKQQAGLFADMPRPKVQKSPGQKFADKMHSMGLIAAKIMRKRSKKGAPMTIDVKKEMADVGAVLRSVQGVSLKALLEVLKGSEVLTVESVLKSGAIASIKRSPADQGKMIKALERIVYVVNRNRKRKAVMKAHAPAVHELIERGAKKRHMKSITGK